MPTKNRSLPHRAARPILRASSAVPDGKLSVTPRSLTVSEPEVLRYAAFSDDPSGGNPAGVVLDASGLDAATMQAIAHDVGFSETAFVTPATTGERLDVRYFSPVAEVPFCGHATIATGVAWAQRHGFGTLGLQTRAGFVRLEVSEDPGGQAPTATLTSAVLKVDRGLLAASRTTPAGLPPEGSSLKAA